MSVLNQNAPKAKAVKTLGDGHYYSWTPDAGWFPLYKDGETVGLREARKYHERGEVAMPSATGVLSCLNKPQIVDWKMEKVAEACWNEASTWDSTTIASKETFIERAVETANNSSKGAMDLGTRVHAGCEDWFHGKDWNAEVDAYMRGFISEATRFGLYKGGLSEQCVGSFKYGVAGKADILHDATLTVGDIKTRGHKLLKTKPSTVPAYETDWMQTATYGFCRYGNRFFKEGRAIIFGVSTVQPGLVTAHVKPGKELIAAFEAMLGLMNVWRFTHSCDPRRPDLEGKK